MKKKIAALSIVMVLMLAFSATVYASPRSGGMMWDNTTQNENVRPCGGGGWGMMGIRGMMWDADGNFLSRDAFAERLDGFIADGTISASQRDFFLEMYDFCGTYGGATGAFRNCAVGGGRGMMNGRRRMMWQ